jgi:type VII secretion protein EccB
VPSRQDQLHSYQYSLQRVVAALVTHDPDPHRSPLRRAGTTALAGLVIAALAVGGAAVYGLLAGHSTVEIADESVVFLEKGSGARYVYLQSDGKLHPVLNYTSGLLIADAPEPTVVGVSRERLATVELGDPLGIPDAPDSLPAGSGELRTGAWSICSHLPAGVAQPKSTVLVGDQLTDGGIPAGPDAQGLLVSDALDRIFLVYGNRRFLIPGARETATLRALGWSTRQPYPVAAAWINAVPVGPDLVPPAIPGLGDASVLGRWEVGRLLTHGGQWGVVLTDGLAPVTEVQAALLQTDPGTHVPDEIGNAFNTLTGSTTRLGGTDAAGGLPATVPTLTEPKSRVCLTLPADDRTGAGIRVDPAVPAGVPVRGGTTVPGGVRADLVHVARGKGALVAAAAAPDAPAGTGTVSIVTDTGLRYPIAGRDLLGKLGYGGSPVQQVPAQLVALLPQGPSLDPARARQARTPAGGPP